MITRSQKKHRPLLMPIVILKAIQIMPCKMFLAFLMGSSKKIHDRLRKIKISYLLTNIYQQCFSRQFQTYQMFSQNVFRMEASDRTSKIYCARASDTNSKFFRAGASDFGSKKHVYIYTGIVRTKCNENN